MPSEPVAEATGQKNLANLLKLIRPLLPPETKKVRPNEYLIDDSVRIIFHYYCRYNAGTTEEEKQKTCYPDQIEVKLNLEKGNKIAKSLEKFQYPTTSQVFRSRTFRSKEDGTFNLKAVAVSVNKALNGVEFYIQRHREKIDLEKKLEIKWEEWKKQLGKQIEVAGLKLYWDRHRSYDSQNNKIEVGMDKPRKLEQEPKYNIDLRGVDRELLTKLLALLKGLDTDTEEDDE